MTSLVFRYKGSSKSGNYQHAGIPGHLGGSTPKKSIYAGPPSEFADAEMRTTGGLQVPENWIVSNVDSVGDDYGFGKPYYIAPDTHDLIDATKANRNMSHETTAVELAKLNPDTFGKAVFSAFNPWVRKGRAFDKMLDLGFIRVRKYSKMDKSVVYSQTMDTPQLRKLQRLVTDEKIPYTSKVVIGWAQDSQGKPTGDRSFMEFTIGDFMMLKYAVWKDNELAFKEQPIHVRYKGSSRSGNYGHAGRIGKVGGSAPKAGYASAQYTRLEDLPSYSHFANGDYVNWTNGKQGRTDDNSDMQMDDIAHDQGFDGKPEVLDDAQFAKSIAQGDIPAYRGICSGAAAAEISITGEPPRLTAPQMTEQFRSGKLHSGWGIYGNGTYTSGGMETATTYARGGNGAVLAMTIRKDSKMIDWEDATKLQNKELEKYRNDKAPEGVTEAMYDTGRWAASKGYDVIRVTPKARIAEEDIHGELKDSHYVILNRTAVRVLNHDLPVGD